MRFLPQIVPEERGIHSENGVQSRVLAPALPWHWGEGVAVSGNSAKKTSKPRTRSQILRVCIGPGPWRLLERDPYAAVDVVPCHGIVIESLPPVVHTVRANGLSERRDLINAY